ncbi:MAG: hypothetical protein ABIY38_03240 [Rhodococcus sp. (in: high G+C Gram-positive bacteria)]
MSYSEMLASAWPSSTSISASVLKAAGFTAATVTNPDIDRVLAERAFTTRAGMKRLELGCGPI